MKKIMIVFASLLVAVGCNWGSATCSNCDCDAGCCDSGKCAQDGCSCSCAKG